LKIGVFGFIAPYKGVYETVQAVSDLLKFGERIELNIIGGIHPRMATARTYKEFLRTLQGLIAQHPEMHMHGYVPSDRLDSLLLANDLMLLPYRSTIGSSGALSYALGLGLPVAVSDYLATFMTLPAGVPTFEPTRESIGRFLSRVLVDRRLPELGPLAELAAERSWESVGRRYRALVLATDPD
jgi:glycosyltransferase involved in cell wall biosynthesis